MGRHDGGKLRVAQVFEVPGDRLVTLAKLAEWSAVAKASGELPLFAADEMEHLRSDWSTIQTGFVDEPRKCVEKADQLVARVVQRLAESFSQERSRLEGQWDKGEDVSTEDLRVALQRYRSFFDRLLSV